jgi:hypothetical protein
MNSEERDPATGFRITRLPRRGPRPGQSTESFLRGKAQGDRRWDQQREANFQRLMQRRSPQPPYQP